MAMMTEFGVLNAKQLAPNSVQAIKMLRFLFSICSYDDLDVSDKRDARKLVARQQCAEASLQRLEIELGYRKRPNAGKKRRALKKKKGDRS
jgi:hypothetical protein